jgi:hypothetical protein
MPDSSLIRERRIGFIGGLLGFFRQHLRSFLWLRRVVLGPPHHRQSR